MNPGAGAKLIARGFSIYFITGVINKAIPFLLLPVMTRYLTPSEFGTVALYQTFLAVFLPIVGMSGNSHIVRSYFGDAREDLAEIIFHVLVAISIVALLTLLVVWAVVPGSEGIFEIPTAWLMVLPIVAFMQTVNKCNLTVYRCQHRAGVYGVLEILRTLVNIGITLWLVVGMGSGWEGRAAGIVSAAFLFGGLGFVLLMRADLVRFRFDLSRLKEIYRISLPLIFYGLGGAMIAVTDRFFINSMMGKEALGIYTVGYTFGALTLIITNAFNTSWSPWLQEQLSNVSRKKKYQIVRFTYLYKAAVVLVALVVTASSYLILPMMTDKAFHGATVVVLWVALGYAARGIYSMFYGYVIHVGKTTVFAWAMLAGGVVNIVGNYLLIPINGLQGAAQASILAWVFNYLIVWRYAAREYPMPWFEVNRTP